MMDNLEIPPQPVLPPQSFSVCDRHPDQPVTGFCASCLRERLAGLDQPNPNPTRLKSSTASSALKAIFRGSNGVRESSYNNRKNKPSSSSSTSFFSELRRSKSFSGGRGEGFSGFLEPQRKSCDVRARSVTLCNLFSIDADKKGESSNEVLGEIEEIETTNLGFSDVEGTTVFELKEEKEEEEEEGGEQMVVDEEEEEESKEVVRVSSDDIVVPVPSLGHLVEDERVEEEITEEIVEEIEEVEEEILMEKKEIMTIKDHIDLESQCQKPMAGGGGGRDLKEIAGNFWVAAAVFSKKLQKWRKKQKLKKRENGGKMPSGKRTSRYFRETQSEVADYGFGRRSCDTDPRFSLDAGRMSIDASRMSIDTSRMSVDAGRPSVDVGRMSVDVGRMSFDDPGSWDEPRASWDGYLIGKMFPRIPSMVSVVEDGPVPLRRIDNLIPVEEPINENVTITSLSGGSLQTNDFNPDSMKRKSLDRPNSLRTINADVDEMKFVSNSKVSPTTIDNLNGSSRISNSLHPLRDDRSESFNSAFRDCDGGDRKGSTKSRRWSKAWSIWGFINRRPSNKDEEEGYYRGNVINRSFSETWPELREINGDPKVGYSQNVFRSNSSVSWRSPSSNVGLFGSRRRSNGEINEQSKKRKEEITLERNRSARYSPNNLDNGLLKFYLTPLRNSRRSESGKNKPKTSHSIARSVFRLYSTEKA